MAHRPLLIISLSRVATKYHNQLCENLAELKRQTSTVRHGGAITISSLPTKPKGRPLKLGDLDRPIQCYIRKLRAAGGIINADVVVASATGVVLSKNRALLTL